MRRPAKSKRLPRSSGIISKRSWSTSTRTAMRCRRQSYVQFHGRSAVNTTFLWSGMSNKVSTVSVWQDRNYSWKNTILTAWRMQKCSALTCIKISEAEMKYLNFPMIFFTVSWSVILEMWNMMRMQHFIRELLIRKKRTCSHRKFYWWTGMMNCWMMLQRMIRNC